MTVHGSTTSKYKSMCSSDGQRAFSYGAPRISPPEVKGHIKHYWNAACLQSGIRIEVGSPWGSL